ncbi:acetyl-CoA carboxylase biotin carboxyl carrier protein [Actinomadura kijaniata]|uniref:acetyl-CoA carboxylase biotin carboxyl carrier protein n=1 Tax=Actinomadura kijaniata TaxID=46161 RepID=UPI00082B8C39|nr:biotin/lipoyl-containing protein [Actinomadura kijaniata]
MSDHDLEIAERLRALREEVTGLVKTVPGPLSGVVVRAGDCSLEVTWAPRPEVAVTLPSSPDAPPEEDAGTAGTAGTVACTAPLVGVFYRAPAPGDLPFVRVGDRVAPGQQVGIVEAMKLMNAVTADVAGEVVAVPAEDGDPVEYGQDLVVVRPDPDGGA